MLKLFAIASIITLVSAGPVGAVVIVDASPHAASPAQPRVRSTATASASAPGLTFGELAAAAIGLTVVSLTVATGRRPYSVSA